jgi:F0F1-type ATP synthase beta subunit
MAESALKAGVIAAVRGSVVDARFPARLPEIFSLLTAGEDASAVIEVVSHLNCDTVRGVALTTMRGLQRVAASENASRLAAMEVADRNMRSARTLSWPTSGTAARMPSHRSCSTGHGL